MADESPGADVEPDEYIVFDADRTELSLKGEASVSRFDVETLEKIGVLTIDTEERDGETVATSCTLDADVLRLMATEFNTVERSLGDRFTRSRWRPDIRLRL